ncbi:MAG: response regulator [Desulfobacterales bacterium]|jgi:DNA-binding response OmpR family regulator|nr:response regulator [Desulfobacterales bacterium]
MKLLVVDDEGIVLESCRRVLEFEGYEVSLAKSADEALELIEKEDFLLLLMDLKMPVHDGIYLMRELKNRKKDVPIIVMSGYSTNETIAEADMMGANLFLPKPFTPDELLAAIREISKRRSAR